MDIVRGPNVAQRLLIAAPGPLAPVQSRPASARFSEQPRCSNLSMRTFGDSLDFLWVTEAEFSKGHCRSKTPKGCRTAAQSASLQNFRTPDAFKYIKACDTIREKCILWGIKLVS